MGRIKARKTEARRLRVAELLAARPGASSRQIVRLVGCSPATAYRDITAIRAEWAARRADRYEDRVAEDLAGTDAAITVLWSAVLAGELAAIDRLVSLLSYRARVLGLDRQRREPAVGEMPAEILCQLAEAGELRPNEAGA
jgi:hypothetical protein